MAAYMGYLACMIQHMSCIERPSIQPKTWNKEQVYQELLIGLQANNNSHYVIHMSYNVFSLLVAILHRRGLIGNSQYNVIE